MEIQHTILGNAKGGILFSEDISRMYRPELEELSQKENYRFFFLKEDQYKAFFKHDPLNHVSYKKLSQTFKKSKELSEYYDNLRKLIKKEKITAVVMNNTGQYWHPDFIKKLRSGGVVVALWTADDDSDTIQYCSLPYTKYYGYHFHVGIRHDRTRTIADYLREHGGNPIWIPLGAKALHINESVNFENRDIDVCYIGNVNPRKFFRLSRLKRHFGDRFKLYGGQGNGDWKSLKGIFYKIANKIFGLGYVQPLSPEELKNVYARTKIGFNMHLFPNRGPSNFRLYELAVNGVAQLCDNKEGLSKIYELDKEVIGFEDIEDAIEKIEYLLSHEEERILMAKAALKKAYPEYTMKRSLCKMLSLIEENTGMKKDS